MKQETKDLIIWIKKQINLAKENCINSAHKDGYSEYEDDYKKAISFLDSLPKIESKLCLGGYIQDYAGNPCCNGDRVRITEKKHDGKTLEGIFTWSKKQGRFYVMTRNRDYNLSDLAYITKVE